MNIEAININNYTKIMFYIWIIGALYLAIKSIYKQIIFHSKIQNITYIVTDEVIIKSLQEQKKALNIKRDINVFKVDGLSSPALIGIIKNRIIIPIAQI
ncbi:M56 family metallopeptidase [Romboutsia weinsteinii]|uniref:M56 family metallopeptidase n=1 Tax=Romboutsia weinsteinii TaxID=2020949 RepID=UPI00237A7F8F|nr:M56 family metallopeptidase [Romboutsia weinsteinii]